MSAPDHPATPRHLIGEELRPTVGTEALDGPRARPGAGSDQLRALAAGQIGRNRRGDRAPVDDAARFKPDADVLEAPLESELVLLDPVAGTYFGLNETAAAIWSLLREGRSVAETAAALSERFGVELKRTRADVERLISRLEAARLVRSCPPVAAAGGQS
jgi:hypothetical protein